MAYTQNAELAQSVKYINHYYEHYNSLPPPLSTAAPFKASAKAPPSFFSYLKFYLLRDLKKVSACYVLVHKTLGLF
jgi:hypothetical protein